MAKRSSSGNSGIVVAQEIRAMIEANNSIKGPEVLTALKEKFPKELFKEKSCQVTYANIRKNMGLSRTIQQKPGAPKAENGTTSWQLACRDRICFDGQKKTVNMSLLQAAKTRLQHCHGDAAVAVQALKQIAALQMN
ncbi:MAG: hypothetical protein WCO86_10285 [Planctomycetota bacterium]